MAPLHYTPRERIVAQKSFIWVVVGKEVSEVLAVAKPRPRLVQRDPH
jgi:hypothetical protein